MKVGLSMIIQVPLSRLILTPSMTIGNMIMFLLCNFVTPEAYWGQFYCGVRVFH